MIKMISGRQGLRMLDGAIAKARSALDTVQTSAGSAKTRLGEIEREEAALHSRLAEARLELVGEDGAARTLGTADERARALLMRHAAELERASADLAEAERGVGELERRRIEAEDAAEEALKRRDGLLAGSLEAIRAEPAYARQLQLAQEAQAVAERAAQKLDVAETDRRDKGEPYEKDPLFSYLWKRRFGTGDYEGGGVFAVLDAWVARLCRYREARLNYARLIEIPVRLREHVERVEDVAETAQTRLETMERIAFKAAGGEEAEEALQARLAEIERIDQAIVEHEERHMALSQDYEERLKGEDGPYAEARELLAHAIARRGVADLRVLAAETISREDDRAVERLVALERERDRLRDEMRDSGRLLDRARKELNELEQIRRRYKRADYDGPYASFPAEQAIMVLLDLFLRGDLSGDNLWERIERAARVARPRWDDDDDDDDDDDWLGDWTGSARRGRGGAWGGGSWGGGSSRRRSSSGPRVRAPRVPRSTGRRGGGFKTGGGF